MDLYSGRREFLLELLSYEYRIPEKYYQCIKEAIVKNSRIHYSAEDIKCLLTMPQSLSATLRLDSINSFSTFQKEFSKWTNCLEYNIFNTNPNIRFTFLNPDPSTKSPLLHVIDNGGKILCLPAKPIIYNSIPRSFELPENHILQDSPRLDSSYTQDNATYYSVWSRDDFTQLTNDFLQFAEQGPNAPFDENRATPSNLSNEELLAAKLSSKESDWAELCMKCRYFFKVGESYVFTEKERGLSIPSNMEAIDQINRSLKNLPRKEPLQKASTNLSNFQKGLNSFTQMLNSRMRQSTKNFSSFTQKKNNTVSPQQPPSNLSSSNPNTTIENDTDDATENK